MLIMYFWENAVSWGFYLLNALFSAGLRKDEISRHLRKVKMICITIFLKQRVRFFAGLIL